MNLDLSKIDNIEVDGVDSRDYPDFCDAYVASADYNGRPMTEDELEWLNDNHPEIAQENAFEHLVCRAERYRD